MGRKDASEEYTIEELRRMLMDKRRSIRKARLDRYRQTGRAVLLAPDMEAQTLDSLRVGPALDQEEAPLRRPRRSLGWQIINGLLLFVEIGAVLVLAFVVFNGFQLIRELNQEVSIALEQPTLTPTPLISAVVLPSGHTSPNSPGGARPNEEEIPDHLRPLVTALANIPLPTPGPEQATRIQIPAIGVDAPIVQGDGWEQLKKGVGQHIGSANPGQADNVVLSAHNDVFGEIFRDLELLKEGDQIIIYTNQRSYTYIVAGTKIVEPTRVEIMAPTRDPIVTLISCYPYLVNTQRIVVQASLLDS